MFCKTTAAALGLLLLGLAAPLSSNPLFFDLRRLSIQTPKVWWVRNRGHRLEIEITTCNKWMVLSGKNQDFR